MFRFVRTEPTMLESMLMSLRFNRGASAAFFVTTAAEEPGFGGLLNIGLCYGLA